MEKLGRTRVHCGVAPEHYVSFGNALLRMLKKTLGPEFTPDLSKAWQEAFLAFADTMNATAADSTTVTMLE